MTDDELTDAWLAGKRLVDGISHDQHLRIAWVLHCRHGRAKAEQQLVLGTRRGAHPSSAASVRVDGSADPAGGRPSAISDANVCARFCTNRNRTDTYRPATYDRFVFIRQLEYLAALARERHFGRASAACHVSQPTLSAGISSLEHELGVPLVRRGRTFEGLTPEGERILRWAERALADLDRLSQEASRLRGGLEGMLRIGAIPTSLPLSPRVTARFRKRHPCMRVRLTSMTSRQIAYGLEHGEIDAGMTYLDNEPLVLVDTLPLWRERYLLVTPRDGELGGEETVPWRTAARLPLCLLTPDMQHRRIVDKAFVSAGAVPAPAVETNSVSTLVAHARAGLPGVTAHTWLEASPLPADLRAIPLVDPEIERTIGLVVSNTVERSPVIAELLSMFEPLELGRTEP